MIINSFKKLLGKAGDSGPGREEGGSEALIGKVLADASALKKSGRHVEAVDMLEDAFLRIHPHPVVGYRLLAGLLDLGQYARMMNLQDARPFNSRDFSIAEFLAKNDPCRMENLPLEIQPSSDRIGYVAMVKDEEDIILFNLVWHYNLGVRRFFIIDNFSSDRTSELVRIFAERFQDATVLTLRDPVVAHFQGRKVTGACQFMRSLWPELEWFVLVDADEFICPGLPLASILDSVDAEASAVIMPKSFYRLTKEEEARETEYFFRRMPHRQPLSHVSNKIIVRAQAAQDIGQGNHRIAETNRLYSAVRYVSSPALTMREFPIRSFSQYSRKVINGGQAVAAAREAGFRNVGGDHWAGQHATFLAQGMEGLRKKFVADLTAHKQRATLSDPMSIEPVMDRLLPAWRTLVPIYSEK